MHSGARFDQILAEKLGHAERTGQPASGLTGRGRLHDPVVLFFDTVARPAASNLRRIAGAYGQDYRPHATAAAPVAPPPSRPSRVLTARQQDALAHLVAMGARLHRNFTDRDLKQAFRTLARLYHPDRHPRSSEFEQARLARQFAMLHEAYRQLLNLSPLPPAA